MLGYPTLSLQFWDLYKKKYCNQEGEKREKERQEKERCVGEQSHFKLQAWDTLEDNSWLSVALETTFYFLVMRNLDEAMIW